MVNMVAIGSFKHGGGRGGERSALYIAFCIVTCRQVAVDEALRGQVPHPLHPVVVCNEVSWDTICNIMRYMYGTAQTTPYKSDAFGWSSPCCSIQSDAFGHVNIAEAITAVCNSMSAVRTFKNEYS